MSDDTSTPTPTFNDWFLLIILSILWGGSFLFGRVLMLEWSPFAVAFLRVSIAAITLWVIIIAMGRAPKFDITFAKQLLIMGLLNNAIPFTLILVGQKQIGSGLAAVVNAMTPIWTLLIANQFTSDEKITPLKIAGIICGFFGVTILIGNDFLDGLHASGWAQIAVLGATISYGFAGVFGKRFKGRDPIIISAGQLTASSLIMFPLLLIVGDSLFAAPITPSLLFCMLGLAIISTAFAYIIYFKILASAGATHTSLVTFLVPISAILLGYLFLGEQLTYANMMGMILILIGLILIDGRAIKRASA